jgi:hypothetical protein
MRAFAISRVDPGAAGIDVLWTWPDSLPLSLKGYDVLRIDSREQRWAEVCETIGPDQIGILRTHAEMTMPLGLLRLWQGAKVHPVAAPSLMPPTLLALPPVLAQGQADVQTLTVPPLASAFLNHAATTIGQIDEFIQELTVPAARATVLATAGGALAIALSNGKAVASGLSGASPTQILLEAADIDTILVYTVAVRTIVICTYTTPKESDADWAHAVVVASGLTLPIHETDPSLATPAQEFAKAKSRLEGAETLDPARFARMADTLRAPAAAGMLGRSGARLSLNRSDAAQSYEEMPLDQQLAALVLHPKARRMLGFGHHDTAGLVPGHAYRYRVIGHFEAADTADVIYDVHRVPAGTVLPDSFWLHDIGLRFQIPVKVVLDPAPGAAALHATSRRGIRIDTTGFDATWLSPSFGAWSAIVSLPAPVTDLVLEVAPGHSFQYAAGLPWSFGNPMPVALPAGPVVHLTFATPVIEFRLLGVGTLYALRLPSGALGVTTLHADTPPVLFAGIPLPAPPILLALTNLSQPPAVLTGAIDETTRVPPRNPVGFRLTWLPASVNAVPIWPDDVESGPPLDAIAYNIEHRGVTLPATFGPWEPITADDNLTLGSRDQTATDLRLDTGCDLDALFPANRPRPNAGLTLSYSDVFGEKDPTTGTVRPAQKLGSYHQYRIRAVDAAGRISGTETVSNIARLEKHTPPPLPAGPQPAPGLDAQGHVAGPTGPRARAIVAGAPGLTPADIALLGAHQNAVLLEWGWRPAERDLDPVAAEFRVYLTRPADVVHATVGAVTSVAPNWKVALTTDLPLVADELAGQWLNSGGYPFRIVHNDAGTTPNLIVEPSKLQSGRQPQAGAVVFGRPLRSEHQRPPGWDQRIAVYPITAADTYRHVFYDVLTLDPAHPNSSVWVGVSSADAESYVADTRAAGALANRSGNESGIVTCAVTARYRGQPVFSVPPPLGDVPEIVTEEPTGRQVIVTLDLAALVAVALPAGSPVALERCGADEVLSRTNVVGNDVVLTHPDGTAQIIPFPNPADHASVLATLNGADPQRLENRYLLHLLAAATDPEAFFARPTGDIVPLGPTADRLAPKPGRFFYYIRAADTLGHLSAGGALLPVVVRVPSAAAAAAPVRRALTGAGGSATLTVAVPADPDTTVVILFADITPPHAMPQAQPEAELLRVPNRRDLYPQDGVRLQLPDGTLLDPAASKLLSDTSVTVEADGTRVASLSVAVAAGGWATLWCYALTRDGQPSRVCGPLGQGVTP